MNQNVSERMNLDYEKDNIERVPFEHYLAEYQKLDPKDIERRCGFPYNEEKKEFSVNFLMKPYRVSFPDYEITPVGSQEGEYLALTATMGAKILLLHHMVSGQLLPPGGKFVTYRDLPWGEVYFRQFQGRCIMRLTYGFGFKPDKFCRGMEAMGAKPVKMGDHAYQFEILDQLSVIFILWEGDDEFQPSVQILFSDNFPQAFEAEDVAHVGDISIGALKALAANL